VKPSKVLGSFAIGALLYLTSMESAFRRPRLYKPVSWRAARIHLLAEGQFPKSKKDVSFRKAPAS
jgi:hypothetical protein